MSRTAMPEAEFWSLVDLLDGRVDDEGVTRLSEALRRAGKPIARRFAERLAAVLYELDREVLAKRTVRWADSPDADPIPLSDDTFLYLRCAVVAAGRPTVLAVLADPAVLESRLWEDGEALLYAADEAADEEIDTELSYETGSNTEHWTPRDDDGPVERPLVAVLFEDLLDPIEGWDGETGEPLVEFAWPQWVGSDVAMDASARADALVRSGGGLPAEPAVVQLVVTLGFGEDWGLEPVIDRQVTDEFGEQISHARAVLRQADVRAWGQEHQLIGILGVAASCLLALLPDDHGSRRQLEAAVAAGADLLPATR